MSAIVTDNAANMKKAFQVMLVNGDATDDRDVDARETKTDLWEGTDAFFSLLCKAGYFSIQRQ